ncbi:Belongs to the peptidase S1 [Homalodisca vitripennis]|nr:Belongs to the peptidase S1 [Homalodisca vitripennis]
MGNSSPQTKCGTPVVGIQKRIIGGAEAYFGEFPWQAHIRISGYQCGGVLLSSRYVATAAHCVYRARLKDILVYLGEYDTQNTGQYLEPVPEEAYRVVGKIVHPNFEYRTSQPDRYDVALVRLARPAVYRENILPICLPQQGDSFSGQTGIQGSVDTSSRDDQRTHASVTLDRGVQCEPFLSPPASVEVGVQCEVPEQPTAGTSERNDLLDRLRTTIEVLEAENQSLKLQLKTCECADYEGNNSHARHIAGLVQKLIGPTTAVNGVCVPGARFLDVVSPARTSSEPRPCCEVLIAGTNDLAVGEQRNIYRHLEGYIAAGSSNTEFILTTLPHRHDLDPTHPVHYQTVLVNAYIEELAVRHKLRVLNFDDIGRRYFTRHGQHLSWRGKRLLAGKIVAAMRPATQGPGMTAQPRFQRNHCTTAATTDNITAPAAARGESATTRQRPAGIQNVTYADAVRRSPSPDILQSKGCSANLKVNSVFLGGPLYSKGLN